MISGINAGVNPGEQGQFVLVETIINDVLINENEVNIKADIIKTEASGI